MPQQIRFYTSERLGPKRSLTPEGFLLCEDVPIARCGTMLYADGEVPVTADRDGIIRIHRDPEDVFDPNAIASWNGKPVTNEHPPEKVQTVNWKVYSVGVALNPRRGDGLTEDNEFLYADLLIQDADAVRDVLAGLREVSGGYDAEYEDIAPGEGRQHLIVGNHVALVDRGRCGPKCMIGDSEMAGDSRRKATVDAAVKMRARVRDQMRQAVAFGKDELVMELARVDSMLGDIISGATESGGFEEVDAPVKGYGASESDAMDSRRKSTRDIDAGGMHIHLHNGGAGDEADPAAGVAPGAAAGQDPAAAGGGSLEERVSALERAVAILAQDNGEQDPDPNAEQSGAPDDDDSGGSKPGGFGGDARRRGRTRDDPPDAPPTEEPSDASSTENPILDRRRAATGDARAMVGDSSGMKAGWQELLSRGEILAPGSRPSMTFDAKRPAKTTFDAMCKYRRKVLDEAMQEDDTREFVTSMAGGRPDLQKMTCDTVAAIFNGASEMARKANSGRTAAVGDGVNYSLHPQQTIDQIAEINRRKNEFWSKRGGIIN